MHPHHAYRLACSPLHQLNQQQLQLFDFSADLETLPINTSPPPSLLRLPPWPQLALPLTLYRENGSFRLGAQCQDSLASRAELCLFYTYVLESLDHGLGQVDSTSGIASRGSDVVDRRHIWMHWSPQGIVELTRS